MEVIFDTNAYRLFCDQYLQNNTQEEKQAVLHKLRECEKEKGVVPRLNLFVLAELLKHLVDTADPGYYRCLQAIQVTFWHTERDKVVNFTPPPEMEICKESFGKLPGAFDKFLNGLGSLYMQVIGDSREQNLENLRPAFQEIAQWISDYKQSFIESYSNYLNETDPLHANHWALFPGKDNKTERKKYIEHLRKDDRRLELAIGLFLFIDKYLDFHVEWTQEDFFKHVEEVKENRKIGFELMLAILEKCLNTEGYDLSGGRNPNDIIDFLFALSLDTTKARILVSGDKDLHTAAKALGISDRVMRLDDYLNSIGFAT